MKKTYLVEYTIEVSRLVEVSASSEADAIQRVKDGQGDLQFEDDIDSSFNICSVEGDED